MLSAGITVESSSPWMAPAVFVRKKLGDVHLCMGYREPNKKMVKNAYPLLRPNEVQDRLAVSSIFLLLICKVDIGNSLYIQTIKQILLFAPDPGMGLLEFTRMPFGLCGAQLFSETNGQGLQRPPILYNLP